MPVLFSLLLLQPFSPLNIGAAQPGFAQDGPVMVGSKSYLGFDKNDYPGDDRLATLRRSFAYTGYWLNTPPAASSNSWAGKRAVLRAHGFGFLILFNGRLDARLIGKDAAALGRADAQSAISAASKEGFPPGAIVFLDQEEGGRLLPEQSAYLFAWVDAIEADSVHKYRPGIYCSGIEVGSGADRISTAEDVLNHRKKSHASQPIALWVFNDRCPPSPGCILPQQPASPAESGIPQALVWQYAQSPRRPQFTRQCAATYAASGNCFAPGMAQDAQSFLDLNVSRSSDPSSGR